MAPSSVDCDAEGPDREAFLASVPGVLRLFHRLVRPRYDRLVAGALGPAVEPSRPGVGAGPGVGVGVGVPSAPGPRR